MVGALGLLLAIAINEYFKNNRIYWYDEYLDNDEPIIEYFKNKELKKFSDIGYVYIDGRGTLHIIEDKSLWERHNEVPKRMMKTTLPHAHGFPIDKNGNAIIIRKEIGTNNIEEKYGRTIPKILKGYIEMLGGCDIVNENRKNTLKL